MLYVLVLVGWLLGSGPPAELDVQGHRGCRGLLPENSMAAFARAIELGVTTLELDLQSTRDRVLVVHHDQRLDPERCVHDDGRPLAPTPLRDLAYRDLADIQCGRLPHPLFPEQRSVPESRIPRFEQVLALAAGAPYAVRLNVEIKMQDEKLGIPVDEFARLVVETVREHRLQARTTVQSFHPPALLAVRALDRDMPTAILARKRRCYGRLLRESRADILSPRFDRLTRRAVRRMHARGIPVVPWTVNEPEDIRRMIAWGVDGIISDYPDRVLALREGNLR